MNRLPKNTKKWDVIKITWFDSFTSCPHWDDADETIKYLTEKTKNFQCVSTGHFLCQANNYIIVAQNLSNNESKCSDVMCIPLCNVVKIERLNK